MTLKRWKILLKTAAAALLLAPASAGATTHSLNALVESVHQFLTQEYSRQNDARVEIRVSPPDPRLRLPQCTQPPQLTFPDGNRQGARVTVGVRCEGDSPWLVYLSAQVQLYRPILVVRQNLGKGERIGPEHLETQERDTAPLVRGYLLDESDALGKTASRPIRAGEVLLPSALETTKLVNKGDNVRIVSEHPGFAIAMSGTALKAGGEGERIPVRNNSSRRVVEGWVSAPGLVTLTP